ncbi:MAG TPA: hypothetical protein VGT98_00260 [Candidatus Elarobacter sp.]|nr:hypothetical protein [Candidatus Elarobacter sp.]HEV2740844.1 hypothetical protein [Candidatus Elarobacter sp.]
MLALAGAVIIAMGAYFVFVRRPLLPEDLRYIHATPEQLRSVAPGLTAWLQLVFRVAGGYMAASGILTVYVAVTSFRTGGRYATIVVAVAGVVSIGLMSAVNFVIDSDFKWFLAAVAALWLVALSMRAWARD